MFTLVVYAVSFKPYINKKNTAALRLGEPAAHPANAYCCFRQDLTGFTPKDRTGPNLHRDTALLLYMTQGKIASIFPRNIIRAFRLRQEAAQQCAADSAANDSVHGPRCG